MTMTTVGFGDFYPSTTFGRVIGSIIAVWGCFVFAFLATSFVLSSKFTEQEESVFKSVRNEKIKFSIINKILQQSKENKMRRHSQDDNSKEDTGDKAKGWQKVRRLVDKIKLSMRSMSKIPGRRQQLIEEINPESFDARIIKLRDKLYEKMNSLE